MSATLTRYTYPGRSAPAATVADGDDEKRLPSDDGALTLSVCPAPAPPTTREYADAFDGTPVSVHVALATRRKMPVGAALTALPSALIVGTVLPPWPLAAAPSSHARCVTFNAAVASEAVPAAALNCIQNPPASLGPSPPIDEDAYGVPRADAAAIDSVYGAKAHTSTESASGAAALTSVPAVVPPPTTLPATATVGSHPIETTEKCAESDHASDVPCGGAETGTGSGLESESADTTRGTTAKYTPASSFATVHGPAKTGIAGVRVGVRVALGVVDAVAGLDGDSAGVALVRAVADGEKEADVDGEELDSPLGDRSGAREVDAATDTVCVDVLSTVGADAIVADGVAA